MTHREICRAQIARNRRYEKKYKRQHQGRKPDIAKGVDNLPVSDVEKYEDEWSKIVDYKRSRGKNS